MALKKKIIFTLLIGSVIFSLTVAWALALEPVEPIDPGGKLKDVGTNAGYTNPEPSVAQTIGSIIKVALSVLGVIFMIYVVYAGYLWMTARGEEEKITKAKAIVRGSIIGLIVILGAYAITAFVVDRITKATNYNPVGYNLSIILPIT